MTTADAMGPPLLHLVSTDMLSEHSLPGKESVRRNSETTFVSSRYTAISLA